MPYPAGFDHEFFLKELDKQRDLVGCRVVYFDGATMSTLRAGPPMSREDLVAVVVRKGGRDLVPTSAEIQAAKDQRFHAELLNLVLSCGGAVFGWVATVTTTGLAPVTGGLSLLITGATTAATIAGWGQCGIAALRTSAQLLDPEILVDLDNETWYQILSTGLDIVGLTGVAATAAATTKAVLILKNSTKKPMIEILKGLSRQERKRLTEEILKSTNPGLSNTKMKLMQTAKAAPKRYTPKAIDDGIRKQLMDVVGAVVNVVGSATGGVIGQLASGPQEDYIVGLVSAYQTQ